MTPAARSGHHAAGGNVRCDKHAGLTVAKTGERSLALRPGFVAVNGNRYDPGDVPTPIRSRAAKGNVCPAAAPVTLDTIVARREERACRQEPKVRGKGAIAVRRQATTENKLKVTPIEIRPAKKR